MKLVAQDLSIGYRSGKSGKLIGSNMVLQLAEGKLTALLGSNGAGKSTLIRTLAGLQPPLSGTVFIDSKELLSWKAADLAKQMALVLQEPIRNNNLNVAEFISLGRTPHTTWLGTLSDADCRIVVDSMAKVGISELADRKITELSDGEWQKASLARALAQDTPVILLDEPTAHLDLLSKIDLIEMLRRIAPTDEKSILFSTHDLDLALQMADEIWLLDGKGAIFTGIPEDLVLQGRISELYSKGSDRGFNLSTGTIEVPARNRGKSIVLTGTGTEYFWTQKALKRNGYQTGTTSGPLSVHVDRQGSVTRWIINYSGSSVTAGSIGELLKQLEQF